MVYQLWVSELIRKSVSDVILDKFAESIEGNNKFFGISSDLIDLMRKKRSSKDEIRQLLRKK